MAYSDENQSTYLKDVFKFYKHLDCSLNVREQIQRYTDSVLKETVFTKLSNSHPVCTVQTLPTEDFIIIKNFFSPTAIEGLWLDALTEWCHLPTAQCNLNTNISPSNRMLSSFTN
ncbi:unnamed protein product [Schistosoma turkestanicum]|nr:unnamed protein product [Schistosoma turkestanicum]